MDIIYSIVWLVLILALITGAAFLYHKQGWASAWHRFVDKALAHVAIVIAALAAGAAYVQSEVSLKQTELLFLDLQDRKYETDHYNEVASAILLSNLYLLEKRTQFNEHAPCTIFRISVPDAMRDFEILKALKSSKYAAEVYNISEFTGIVIQELRKMEATAPCDSLDRAEQINMSKDASNLFLEVREDINDLASRITALLPEKQK